MFSKEKMKKDNIIMMFTGVIGMGIFLSFLLNVDFGVDTATFLNNSIAERTHLPLGTIMILMNSICLVPQLIFGRDLIHLGTIANMTMIGYIADFCRFLENRYLPAAMFQVLGWRILTFAVSLFLFLICVALYMNADLGQVPFDSIAIMVSRGFHLPFMLVRMVWDFLLIAGGLLAGGKLHIATVILALTVGPAVTAVGKVINKMLGRSELGKAEEA